MNKKSRFRQIHTSNPDYCLDVYGGLKKSNIPIISFKCHTGTNQKFLYNKKTKQIQAKHSKKCFDTKKQKVVQKNVIPVRNLKNGIIKIKIGYL